MMRLDYWKASMALIQKHLITGVGTGDMNRVFDQYYNEINSKLKPEWRRRSHNQFLSITVGFGILGLTWFLFSLIYPPVVLKKLSNFLFGSFFLLVFMSMIPEDTIESQEGVTFVAFFFSFLLFANEEKSD
ncbi:MAG: O-antigen ligase family protein [Bacteroidetes bacterium]|nr:O-antigen ligase family protein [Bacteroidota bacterium]